MLQLFLVATLPQRAAVAAQILAVTLLVGLHSPRCSAAMPGGRDITQFSLEELANLVVMPASRKTEPELSRYSAAVAAVEEVRMRPQIRSIRVSVSGEFQEYNLPNPDPGIYASPSDMGFGATPPMVAAAIRALGSSF